MNVGAGGSRRAHVGGLANLVQDCLTQLVYLVEVRAHTLRHNVRGDVDHVRVAHAAAVHNIRHLHAAVEFVLLHFYREDADLRALHVFEHGHRHADERARRNLFQHKRVPRAANRLQLKRNRRSDDETAAICDERDFFLALNLQAGNHRIAGAFRKIRRKCDAQQIGLHLSWPGFYVWRYIVHWHSSRISRYGRIGSFYSPTRVSAAM